MRAPAPHRAASRPHRDQLPGRRDSRRPGSAFWGSSRRLPGGHPASVWDTRRPPTSRVRYAPTRPNAARSRRRDLITRRNSSAELILLPGRDGSYTTSSMWRSSRRPVGLAGPRGLDVSPGTSHAAENCERHKEIHLTSSVAADYTANLRCTLTSSTSPNYSWRVRGRFACVR